MVRLESIAPASSARSRASSKFVNGLSKDPVLSEFDLLSKNKRGSLATTSGSESEEAELGAHWPISREESRRKRKVEGGQRVHCWGEGPKQSRQYSLQGRH